MSPSPDTNHRNLAPARRITRAPRNTDYQQQQQQQHHQQQGPRRGPAPITTNPLPARNSSSPFSPPTHSTPSFTYGGSSATTTGISRLARHSPSLSSTAGSPTSSPQSGLASLLTTQLQILLSTLKEGSSLETQRLKIKKLLDDSGMEMFSQFFGRLLQTNAATIFSNAPKNRDTYPVLLAEVEKLADDPEQADKVAQSLEGDFDLAAFIQHFSLEPIAKTSLLTSLRTLTSKPELRAKGVYTCLPVPLHHTTKLTRALFSRRPALRKLPDLPRECGGRRPGHLTIGSRRDRRTTHQSSDKRRLSA